MAKGRSRARAKAGAAAAVQWYRQRRRVVHGWAHVFVPLTLLLSLVSLRAAQLSWVEGLQHKAFDALQELRPRPYEEAPVRVIDIDEETLARLGQWPWPRNLVAKLVRRLDELGAAVIAFDVLFPEPDRTSPASILNLWPHTPETDSLRRNPSRIPDPDQVLAEALGNARTVLGFALIPEPDKSTPVRKCAFAYAGDGPLAYLRDFQGAVVDLPQLQAAASGNGSINFIPERDGMVRVAPLLMRHTQALVPSLWAETLRVAQGAANFGIKSSGASGERAYGEHTGISRVKIGRYVVPTDAEGGLWLYFTENTPQRTIPAWQIFEKNFDRSRVEGKILYVGTSAAGLKDLRATPLNPARPGVEVHANATEQALLGRYLQRPDWVTGGEIVYMVAFGVLLLALMPWLGALWCAFVALAGMAAALGFSWKVFVARGYLVDPIFPCLTVFAVYLSSALISFLKSETERRQVRHAFTRYMHPKLVEELAKHPEKLKLGGETRNMTVLFCDIRGFTTISEQFDAHGLTHMINLFLTPMTEIIMAQRGYIDKYIGDCIMAFWNAPLDDPGHAANACTAALAMHSRLNELDAVWRARAEHEGRKHVPIHIGIGLNTGDCCVGNMGSDQRFNYSVLGDDVNLASRLEGQSKPYGVDTVIGPRTRELAPEFAALELDLIKVKGKTKPVHIFALLGPPQLAADLEFKQHQHLHESMLSAYRAQEWDRAENLLAQCRHTELPLTKLHLLYEKRIRAFRETPPSPDWDGTFTATSK